MQCPLCKSTNMYIYDTRTYGRKYGRLRYYVCVDCEHRFSSEEVLSLEPMREVGIPNHLKRRLS